VEQFDTILQAIRDSAIDGVSSPLFLQSSTDVFSASQKLQNALDTMSEKSAMLQDPLFQKVSCHDINLRPYKSIPGTPDLMNAFNSTPHFVEDLTRLSLEVL
jgi:hypothetical protein